MKKISLLTLALALAFAVSAWGQASLRISNGPNVQWVQNGKAQIAWSTDQPSAGQDIVRMGTNPNALTQTIVARQDQQERNGGWNHMAQLVNLQPGQTYFFQIQSQGSQGVLTSQIGSFVAQGGNQQGAYPVTYPYQGGAYNPYQGAYNQGAYNQGSYNQGSYGSQQGTYNSSQGSYGANNNGSVQINNGPNVEKTGDTNVQIAWSTNMPGQSSVHYGTNPNNLGRTVNDQVSQNAPEANGSYNHRVMISGLRPNTTYFFVVETNGVRSTPQQFRTK